MMMKPFEVRIELCAQRNYSAITSCLLVILPPGKTHIQACEVRTT
jgi:hypothetical protein